MGVSGAVDQAVQAVGHNVGGGYCRLRVPLRLGKWTARLVRRLGVQKVRELPRPRSNASLRPDRRHRPLVAMGHGLRGATWCFPHRGAGVRGR